MAYPTLRLSNGRNFVGRQLYSHIVWNEHNPNNLWQKGYNIHHKDRNPLNDDISNLELLTIAQHQNLHKIGTKHSEETKKKMSKSAKGKIVSEETRKKLAEFNTGRKASEETKRKMSESRKGELNPNYGNGKKISGELNPMYGSHRSGELNPFYGNKHTDEVKKKISNKNKGNTYCIGRKYTEETRKKISEAIKKYWANKKEKE